MSEIDEITKIQIVSENEELVGSEEDTHSSDHFIDTISDEEKKELVDTIHELLEEYVKKEIMTISNPDYHNYMLEEVTAIIFASLCEGSICSKNDYEGILEFVESTVTDWYDQNPNYPLRQQSHFDNESYIHMFGLSPEFVTRMIGGKLEKLQMENALLPEQRTPEWYLTRHNMITASNLYKIFGSEAVQNQLIFEKCKPLLETSSSESTFVNTESSTHWGVKYEPLSQLFYESLTKVTPESFGCIPHPRYPFIGASPDGIVTDSSSVFYGRMLEIKNIVNRKIDGIPSEAYWVQMQIQMEVCDLDVCDFLETRFKEYEEVEFYEDSINEKGVILYFVKREYGSNSPYYVYMPLDHKKDSPEDVNEWIEQQKSENPDYILFKTIYWYLDEYSLITVRRNDEWFSSVLPQIADFWELIQKERVSGYEHRAPKKRSGSFVEVVKLDVSM